MKNKLPKTKLFDDKLKEQLRYYRKEHSYLLYKDTNFVNNIVQRFIEKSKLDINSKILEIGCGKGRFSIPLLNKGYSLVCLDPSKEMLDDFRKIVSKKYLKNISFVQNILPKYYNSYEGNKFDDIIGFHVLHHLKNLENELKIMHSLLKDEGKIIFLEPNVTNILYYIQLLVSKDVSWEGEKGYLNIFDYKLRRVLKKAGFKKIQIKKFGFFPDFIVNSKKGYEFEKFIDDKKINMMPLFKVIIARK